MQKIALKTASLIFLLVAVLHLLRLIFKWEVMIAGHMIPMWVSLLGCAVPLALSAWMCKASK